MSLRSRARSVILAGTLACSLSVGSLAFAAEGAAGSAAVDAGAADLGSAITQIAETPTTPGTAAATTPAYKTVASGPLTFQVGETWQATSLTSDPSTGIYDIYTDISASVGVLQTIVVPESALGQEDAMVDEFLGSMTSSAGMTSYEIDDPEDHTIDGTLVRDLDFSGVVEGDEFDGLATFVFGSDYTGIVVSVYLDDGDDTTENAFEHAHDSISLTVSNATAAQGAGLTLSSDSADTSSNTAATAPAAGANASATTPSTGTNASATAPAATDNAGTTNGGSVSSPTSVAAGTPIEFGGFSYLVNTDPSSFVRTAVETYEGDPLNGTAVIGVPVTITNNTTETTAPEAFFISTYGPNGLEQDDMAAYYLDDSTINVTSMRPGASVNAVLYFLDEGAGEYVAVFDDYSGTPQEISITVE